ncbi:MAG: transcription factor S [Candidatus Nanoarchaeia archaeon]|nr:transcription factor S [Candidatus Nanoarchaeia archaeon]
MEFCCKCGALMMPKKEKGENILSCTGCGHNECLKGEIEIKQKKKETKEVKFTVEDDESKKASMPVVKEQCSKCKNKEAYFWTVQTRAADEPPTKFYRCTKCGHTWRDYS